MVNGPPTPPPTTETELHDQARMPVSSPVADNAVPLQVESTARPETYRQFLPIIGELIAKKDFEGLVRVAETVDIQVHRVTAACFRDPYTPT